MTYNTALILIILFAILFGYFFGSLNWSIILGKLFYKKDPRDFESKNAGATNSIRIYGKKTAAIILFLDVMKSFLSTIFTFLIAKFAFGSILDLHITNSFNPYVLIYLGGIFATIGHCFPIFFKFKGGKGASTFGGTLWAISPIMAIFLLILSLLILKKTKMASFSVLIVAFFSLFTIFIPGLNYCFLLEPDIKKLILLTTVSIEQISLLFAFQTIGFIIILIKHKENIKRIINKEERLLSLKKTS